MCIITVSIRAKEEIPLQETQYAIEMVNITKKFPGIIANDNVSAMQVRCSAEGIDIKIVDMQGKSTFEQRF